MSRFFLAVSLLILVYALVLVSVDPWDLAIGALLGGGLLGASRRFVFADGDGPAASLPRRMLAFVPFAAAVVWAILKGTWEVALVVLHVRPLAHPGIVAVPIGERSELGVVVAALETSLSPGSVLVDIDWERRVMLIHYLDASDPATIRADQQRFYERHQRRVFP